MSWPPMPSVPTVWAPNVGTAAQVQPMNMGMFQQTANNANSMYQQYALQQQSWEQWQIYQTQLAQWQAQYGEQYQQMQNQTMNAQNTTVQGGFGAPPPPPPDYQPPPPPPAQTAQNPEAQPQADPQVHVQILNLQQPPPPIINTSLAPQQQPEHSPKVDEPSQSTHLTQTQSSTSVMSNQDGFRRNNCTNRWGNNNNNNSGGGNNSNSDNYTNSGNNNRNNRMFGGHNNYNNRNTNYRDDHAVNDYDNEEKSQEEIAFDISYQKWEDQLAEWKRNNANHPDRNQYNDFVTKMEGCRQQLMQRRENLRQKRLAKMGTPWERNRNANPVDPVAQTNPSQQNMNQQEMQTDVIEEEHIEQAIAPVNTFQSDENVAAGLFSSERGDGNAGIPGLDLVSGEHGPPVELNQPSLSVEPNQCVTSPMSELKKAEPDSNILARVTNILENPEIQSLLSNIQKQQHTMTSQSNVAAGDFHENDRRGNIDYFNQQGQQHTDESQRNPFRPNSRFDTDMNKQHDCEYEVSSKRGRYMNENSGNERAQFHRGDRFERERNNPFTQQTTSHDTATRDFGRFNKKSDETDNFNASNANMKIDFDDFRPIQVIDYQNKKQTSVPFANPSTFPNVIPSNMRNTEDNFLRKVIDYDHKSKTHPWNSFCPVIQIEYNHTKNGVSLHEHPPPKVAKLEREKQQIRQDYVKRDHFPSKQQQWQQNERQERMFHTNQGDRYHQSRFEHRQSNEMPSYSNRRNPQERDWSRNYQEWNTPKGSYAQDRIVSSAPRRDDMSTKPDTSTFQHNRGNVAKEVPRIKFNIKNLLFPPGRTVRPKKIVIIMRGIPGSGKSYLSKLIKEKENEMGGSARILSIDDYFMDNDGPSLSYKFEADMEEKYTQSMLKSFKKTLFDNLYECIIVDCKNTKLNHLNEFVSFAQSCLFMPYICELPLDLELCLRNNGLNGHNRSSKDIRDALDEWVPTPSSYTVLDYSYLFNSADNTEEISDVEDDKEAEAFDAVSDEDNKVEKHADDEFSDEDGDDQLMNEFGIFKSKWDNDTTENKLARLDGINKPMKHTTIEDYLQMDGWEPPPTSTNGKKRVRWADIEQKREQDKQRAIGFIVGQTDWKNLIDEPRDHSNALTAVKYIEKIRKN